MVFRSGKYKGQSLEVVKQINPGYIRWIRENRPEMLVERKPTPKKKELCDEEIEQQNNYKNLPKLDWAQAF